LTCCCAGYAAALARYMQANPECFDPSRVVAGYSDCSVNETAFEAACTDNPALMCIENLKMSKPGLSVSMDVRVCVPLVCSSEDLYIMLETAADSECAPDQFTYCSVNMCGVSYEYTPPPTPSPAPVCGKGVSSGAAAGLAITMLLTGGAIGAGLLWWLRVRSRPAGSAAASGKFAASTSYTDL
jgi:hypothetical protein